MASSKRSTSAGLSKKRAQAVGDFLARSAPSLTRAQRRALVVLLEENTKAAPPRPEAEQLRLTTFKDRTTAKRRTVGAMLLSLSKIVGTAYGVKALAAGALITLAGVSAPLWPFVLFGAALTFCSEAKSLKGQRLLEADAIVLWTLWLSRDKKNRVKADNFLAAVNDQRKACGRRSVSEEGLDRSLETLVKDGLIEATEGPAGWRIKEIISVG